MDSDRKKIAGLTPGKVSRLSEEKVIEVLGALTRLADEWIIRKNASDAYIDSGSSFPEEALKIRQKLEADKRMIAGNIRLAKHRLEKIKEHKEWEKKRRLSLILERKRKQRIKRFADATSDTSERYALSRSVIGEEAFSEVVSQDEPFKLDPFWELRIPVGNRYEVIKQACEHG